MLAFQIDDALEQMAIEGRTHFSPHFVCTYIGVADLKSVTEYMLKLVGVKLNVYYEVECPEGDSDFIISSPDDLVGDLRHCSYCGVEYIPSWDRVWIAFDFRQEYLDFVKKKKRRLSGLTQ